MKLHVIFFPKTTVLIKFGVSLTIVNDNPSLTIVNDDLSLTIVNDDPLLRIVNNVPSLTIVNISVKKKISKTIIFLKTIVSENEMIVFENETKNDRLTIVYKNGEQP